MRLPLAQPRLRGLTGCSYAAAVVLRPGLPPRAAPIAAARARVTVKARAADDPMLPAQSVQASRDTLIGELDGLAYSELKARLKTLGLSASGKKAQLVERLADAVLAEAEVPGTTSEGPTADLAGKATSDADEGALDATAIRADLAGLDTEQLVSLLASYGLSTEGGRSELIERLAQLLEDEEWEDEAEDGDADSGFTAEQQALLLGARVKAALAEVAPRQRHDIYHELKQSVPPGVVVTYLSKDELAQELAQIRAAATLTRQLNDPQERAALRAELAELAEAGGAVELQPTPLRSGVATGVANCGVELTVENADPEVLLTLPLSALKKLKPDEMRAALHALGKPDAIGNRYKLYEQLVATIQAKQMGDLAPDVAQAVVNMSLRELRAQLSDRGLTATGSRAAMQARLQEALAAEEQEALEEQQEAARSHEAETLPPLTIENRLIKDDPPITLSVLFGAPGGTLSDLQASLDAARCVAAGTHTAWPPLVPDEPLSPDVEDQEGLPDQTAVAPSDGIAVRLLYVLRDFSVLELPASSVHGVSAAELVAGQPFVDALEEPTRDNAALGALLATPLIEDATHPKPCMAMSVVSAAGLSPIGLQQLQDLHSHAATSVPLLGAGPPQDKPDIMARLKAAGFPVLPAFVVRHQAWQAGLDAWAAKQGYHPQRQPYIVKPAHGSGGRGIVPALGIEGVVAAAAELLAALHEEAGPGAAADVQVVVEPNMVNDAKRVTVNVIDGRGGPLALLPTELEVVDVEQQIFESQLQQRERELMRDGCTEAQIWEALSGMRAEGLVKDADTVALSHRRPLPFTCTVKHHSPPRLPRKLVHAIRHGAALAYQRLGLTGGARIDLWVAMDADWQDKYERPDDGMGRLLPDLDPGIMLQVVQSVKQADELVGPPMSAYFDYQTRRADLASFNPSTWLTAAHNGEATVFFSGMVSGLDLDPGSPVFMQAGSAGLSHAALLRTLVNGALRRGPGHPDPPPATGSPKRKGRGGRAASKTPQPTSSGQAVQLAAPPPLDPFELAPLRHVRLDELDVLQNVTHWRERQWLEDAEDEVDRRQHLETALNLAELLDEALSGQEVIQEDAQGNVDLDALPYAYADDWGVDFDAEPVEAARQEEDGGPPVQLATMSEARPDELLQLEELRSRYPGLPEEDLMYVKLGHGPDGRVVDTDRLAALLAERAAVAGGEEPPLAVDALAACLVDPETGVVGEPVVQVWGEAAEPGGFKAANHRIDPAVADESKKAEERFSNSRFLQPQKVWLLVGGEPEGTNEALRSAADVQRTLAQHPDVQVEVFLCCPGTTPGNQETVLAGHLKRRVEWLSSGFPERELPVHMSPIMLRNLPVDQLSPDSELVWALPPSAVAPLPAATISSTAEAALQQATVAHHAQPTLSQQAALVVVETALELQEGGVEGVGGLWGGNAAAPPIAPRLLSLADMAREAADAGAVVVPLLRGGYTAHVHQLLYDTDAAYVGLNPACAMQCTDKLACAAAVDAVCDEESGWNTMPRQMLVAGAVAEAAFDPEYAEAMMDELRSVLTPGYQEAVDEAEEGEEPTDHIIPPPLCIRPTHGADGVGVARLDTAMDLRIYAQAMGYGVQCLPPNTLSSPHRAIPMPRYPPDTFMLEPWAASDTATVVAATQPGQEAEVQLGPTTSGWSEVAICLLGGLGSMEPLSISLRASLPPELPGSAATQLLSSQVASAVKRKQADKRAQEGTATQDGQTDAGTSEQDTSMSQSGKADTEAVQAQPSPRPEPGAHLYLTPAPPSVLSDAVFEVVMGRARELADSLGLQGLARVDAFVERETGDLVLIEADPCPSLALDSLVYQQARFRAQGGLGPAGLLRELFRTGLLAARDDGQGVELGVGSELGGAADTVLGDEEAALGLEDQDLLAQFDEEDGLVVGPGGDEDVMGDLAELQASAPSDLVGVSDMNEAYLSSSGRGARRGRPRRVADDDFGLDGDDAGGGDFMRGDDFDIDGQGQTPEDPDYQDNWRIRNYS